MLFERKVTIGIDFGLTNSRACYIDPHDGETQLIYDMGWNSQYASMLSFRKDEVGNLIQFGNPAKTNYLLYDKSIIREVKRFVGKTYEEMEEMAEKLGLTIEGGEDDECIFVIPDPDGGEEDLKFTAQELVAIELRYIKDIILERCANADFSKVVMTIPSSFNPKQREVMKYAFELAGINPITVMNEPSAALFEYKHFDAARNIKKAVVIDIGGGTTDVCICEPAGKTASVKGNGGDAKLGGSDFDQIIQDMIIAQLDDNGYDKMYLFRQQKGENQRQKNDRTKTLNKLKKEAEKIKISLSKNESYNLDLQTILPRGDDFDADIIITKTDFEEKLIE